MSLQDEFYERVSPELERLDQLLDEPLDYSPYPLAPTCTHANVEYLDQVMDGYHVNGIFCHDCQSFVQDLDLPEESEDDGTYKGWIR